MPAIYHEGAWLGNATDPEVLVKDTVGWTGKNRAYSQTNNAVIAHIENGITYDVSWTGSATVTLKKNSTSGATITSGNTSPLSFTADADYELYFGSSATVTNIMVKDSRITDPTYEPYHESVEEEIEQIYADNGVLGAKNLLPNTGTSQTINGITFTVNDDGSVTANGTATAQAIFWVTGSNNNRYTFDKDVIVSGCPSGGSDSTYALSGNNVGIVTDEAMITAGKAISVACVIYSGVTVSNIVFKPMLRLASDPDDTYQPYAMTNRELTDFAKHTKTVTLGNASTYTFSFPAAADNNNIHALFLALMSSTGNTDVNVLAGYRITNAAGNIKTITGAATGTFDTTTGKFTINADGPYRTLTIISNAEILS